MDTIHSLINVALISNDSRQYSVIKVKYIYFNMTNFWQNSVHILAIHICS